MAIVGEKVSMSEGRVGKGGPRNRVTRDSIVDDDDDCGVTGKWPCKSSEYYCYDRRQRASI